MCVSQAAWVRTQVHFSPVSATPLSNFKVLMSQEWGGRRHSIPLGQTEWGKPSQEEKGNLFTGFAVAVSYTVLWNQSLERDAGEWRLRHRPRAQKKSISPQWGGGRPEGRGQAGGWEVQSQSTRVHNSPAILHTSAVHSHLHARVTHSCHNAGGLWARKIKYKYINSLIFTEKPES